MFCPNCPPGVTVLNGTSGLGDMTDPMALPPGAAVGAGALAMGSAALGGALVGYLAGGNGTAAATGALVAGGLQGIGWGGFAAIASPTLRGVGVALLAGGAAMLYFGGKRAYHSVRAGRPSK